MSKVTLFYVPFPSKEEAESVIKILLSEIMIACGQILSVQSYYHWENQLCQDPEYPVILKTTSENAGIVESRIKQLHSYEVPAIMHWQTEINEAYSLWVQKEVN
jgi:periplasmic divalent cation tolerance protein